MARGRKKITGTLEEQLESIQADIDKTADVLKAFKAKKKVLEGKIEAEQKEKLYEAVRQSGKSIEDILATLPAE